MDVLHAEVEQGKENDDGLLLVPRDIVGNRKIVDVIQAEHLFELQRDQCKRVGIVALAGIEYARDAADIAEILLDILILRTACRKDDRIVRQLLCEFAIVVARLHAAVTAAHYDKLLDRTTLHGLNDLIRNGKDLLMREPADDLARLQLRRGGALLRALDDGREILLTVNERDMRTARHADSSRCEKTVLVAVLRRHNAVCRHENRTVKLLELFLLLPPRVAVVADEVVVLLERGVVMRGDHLAMRIDIDARTLRLLEEALEILEVMTGDKDARTITDAEFYLRNLWVAVTLRVRRIEERHAGNAPLARLENKSRQRTAVHRIVEQLCQRALQEHIHFLVLVAQRIRVLHIGREALKPVSRKLTQASYVLVLRCEHADRLCLRRELCTRCRPMRRRRQMRGIAQVAEQLLLQRECLIDHIHDRLTVKIRVRDRHEKIHRHTVIRLDRNALALCAQRRRHSAEPLRHIDKEILHFRDIRLLAADPLHRAALAARRFLALIAKHFSIHGNFSFAPVIIHISYSNYSKGISEGA